MKIFNFVTGEIEEHTVVSEQIHYYLPVSLQPLGQKYYNHPMRQLIFRQVLIFITNLLTWLAMQKNTSTLTFDEVDQQYFAKAAGGLQEEIIRLIGVKCN